MLSAYPLAFRLPASVLAALTLSSVQLSSQQVGRTPVEVTVLASPAALTALGRTHLVYEVHLTNFGAAPIRVESLDVLDEHQQSVEALVGVRLAQRTSILGVPPARTDGGPVLPPGMRAVVYLFVSLAPERTAPTRLQHRLVMSTDAATRDTLLTSTTPVIATDRAPIIAAPVRGGPWVALRAPSATSGHRLSLVTLDGVTRVPQRFAVDWARLGADGKLFHGDSTKNESWYSYGDTVFAVAAGKVVLARDSMPNGTPLTAPSAGPMDARAATGNVLVLQMADGRFASFAHLQRGTQRVKVGDMVREGQAIALIGNSGNTFAPHLHFQVSSAAELLAGEGLPYALRQFELVGRVAALPPLLSGTPWMANPAQPARIVNNESLLENMVVRFGRK